jgi:hypothetical protein
MSGFGSFSPVQIWHQGCESNAATLVAPKAVGQQIAKCLIEEIDQDQAAWIFNSGARLESC